jgi:hypothetical protein
MSSSFRNFTSAPCRCGQADWSGRDGLPCLSPATEDRFSAEVAHGGVEQRWSLEVVGASPPDDVLCLDPLRASAHAQAQGTRNRAYLLAGMTAPESAESCRSATPRPGDPGLARRDRLDLRDRRPRAGASFAGPEQAISWAMRELIGPAAAAGLTSGMGQGHGCVDDLGSEGYGRTRLASELGTAADVPLLDRGSRPVRPPDRPRRFGDRRARGTPRRPAQHAWSQHGDHGPLGGSFPRDRVAAPG